MEWPAAYNCRHMRISHIHLPGKRSCNNAKFALWRFCRCVFLLLATATTGAWADAPSAAVPVEETLWHDFVSPPDSARPWAYYLWQNGLADRETITEDLESMKRLGFGGINMVESRHALVAPLLDEAARVDQSQASAEDIALGVFGAIGFGSAPAVGPDWACCDKDSTMAFRQSWKSNERKIKS